MSLKDFLTSRTFLKHLLLAVSLVLFLVIFTLWRLKSYTHHGESQAVPDFSGLTVERAEEIADDNDLQIEVTDSIHFDGAQPGVVVEQVPVPGFKVKKNRIIFLTLNSTTPEKVNLPKLNDISFRQVQALVENCGITVGKITYEASEFNDLVLKVTQNGVELKQGDVVEKGSTVDIVIGKSSGSLDTPLPELIGMSFTDAKNTLTIYMLNVGVLIYDPSVITVEDSANAMVWKQYPATTNTKIVNIGTSVDLWLSLDTLQTGVLSPDSIK